MKAWTWQGLGAVGLITYMRTDSLRISDEAAQGRKAAYHRSRRYGEQYLPRTKPRVYKNKDQHPRWRMRRFVRPWPVDDALSKVKAVADPSTSTSCTS